MQSLIHGIMRSLMDINHTLDLYKVEAVQSYFTAMCNKGQVETN